MTARKRQTFYVQWKKIKKQLDKIEQSFILGHMRTKDEHKRIAIYYAAMKIITSDGLSKTSMSKIAKAAGVSSSTIYVYFENKEDMLNKLYLMAKEEASGIILQGLHNHIEVKAGFELFMRNCFSYSLSYPVKFLFQEQFYGSPDLNAETRKTAELYYAPLFKILDRGRQQGIIKDCPGELMGAFLFAPALFVVKAHHNKELEATAEIIEKTIEMTWHAIRAWHGVG